jgi:hypothetical protein
MLLHENRKNKIIIYFIITVLLVDSRVAVRLSITNLIDVCAERLITIIKTALNRNPVPAVNIL